MIKFPNGEAAAITRNGEAVVTVLAGFDPHTKAFYLPPGTDVDLGDVIVFRFNPWRVTLQPEIWRNPFTAWDAGIVAYVEPTSGYAALPDSGMLTRSAGSVWDQPSNTLIETWTELWIGPCSITLDAGRGTSAEDVEQRFNIQPLTVSTPLTLIDVRPDDIFTVTDSADQRLVGRPLQVVRVQSESLGNFRQFTVVDNQD